MESDITIIGAGVVGLAVASEVAKKDRNVFVIEKHKQFGQETSSRNSEVLHTGIYYPESSLKAKLCGEGREEIYRICEENNIDYQKPGKLIVTVDEREVKGLEELIKQGKKNGVNDLRILSKKDIEKLEPNINAIAALYSPSTGIIDSHALMKYFERKAKQNNADMIYGCEVINIEKLSGGYRVSVKEPDGSDFSFSSRIIVNSAGLSSDKIAKLAGIDIDEAGYNLYYCKGEYFSVGKGKHKMVNSLIYPAPKGDVSLGIHTVKDLQGMLKLGPSADYINKIDYAVDENHKKQFHDSIKEFLPFIDYKDLSPDMSGIRPKLHKNGKFRDFVIKEETDKGYPGLINLIGIESPGLTSSPAIAKYVANRIIL